MMMKNTRKLESYKDLKQYKQEMRIELEGKEELLEADIDLLKQKIRPSYIFAQLAKNVKEYRSEAIQQSMLGEVFNVTLTQFIRKKSMSGALLGISKSIGSMLALKYSDVIIEKVQKVVSRFNKKDEQ